MEPRQPFVLIAEDDPDGRIIYTEVLKQTSIQVHYEFVGSGADLMDHLRDESKRRPCLVLMDLRFPVDGDTLESIMEDEGVRAVPLVILTSEEEETAARHAYARCANSYIIKPRLFKEQVETMDRIFCYWFRTVKLPW